MTNLRLFQISCPIFWGFNRYINIDKHATLNDCVNEFLDIHEQFLFQNNYIDLLNFFKTVRIDYHVHDTNEATFMNTTDTVFVCRHPRVEDNNTCDNHDTGCDTCNSLHSHNSFLR